MTKNALWQSALALVATFALTATHAVSAAAANLDARHSFSIPAQKLSAALLAFSEQANIQVMTASADLANLNSSGIAGEKTVREALEALLLNTGLRFYMVSADAVAIEPIKPGRTQAAADILAVEEIVVTGSHIRGAQQGASPVVVFDREDIRKSGVSSTQQFIQSLVQNFGGGASDTTLGGLLGGEGSGENYGNASGANLRGLGNDATLTLLNGRRVAPVGIGEAVDLSVIPLAAIERIDVLTDGASAIYGSDAVGGVINIILRKGYEGAETHLRYGTVTQGSSADITAGQTVGLDWTSGSLLASYEYAKRTELTTDEREFTRDNLLVVGGPLVPPTQRHSGLVSMAQSLTDRIDLFADGLASKRDNDARYLLLGNEVATPTSVEQYGGDAGLRVELGGAWRVELAGTYNRSNTRYQELVGGVISSDVDMQSEVSAVDVLADGALFELPGGSVKLAVGGQYRHETFDSRATRINTGGAESRDISAVFGELRLPLIGPGNRVQGAERLELTAAGRFEDYSDSGSTTNPKLGLVWSPLRGLDLRGTYSTSFRAPSLYEASERAVAVHPSLYAIPDTFGTTNTIILTGHNANLLPEEATSWTFGFDVEPAPLPGLRLSLTWFDIEFTDRIGTPIAEDQFYQMLIDEAHHASFVNRNPDLATVQALLADPRLFNTLGGPVPPATSIGAIVDDQLHNVARVAQSGIDFDVNYAFDTRLGNFSLRTSGTHLLKMQNQVTAASPVVEGLNRLRRPVDLKLRNSVSWSRNELAATLFVNYVDSYRDLRPGVDSKVDSWTTVDFTVRYDTGARFGWFGGTQLSVAVLNAFNEPPPFVDYFGFNFDATNASALGRFVSIDIAKQFFR